MRRWRHEESKKDITLYILYSELTVAVAPKQVRDYVVDEVFNNIEIVLFLNMLEIHFSRRVLILRCHENRFKVTKAENTDLILVSESKQTREHWVMKYDKAGLVLEQ